MKANQAVVRVLPLALLLVASCSHETTAVSTPPPPEGTAPLAASSQAPSATTAPIAERGAYGAGPAKAMLDASEGLRLSDAHREMLRTLRDQLEANGRDTQTAFHALRMELARQVRAGTIDIAALQPQENAAALALQAHIDKEVDTLNTLHGSLDPSQRAAVVAAVRATQPGRTETQPPTGAPPSSEAMRQKKLDRLTTELGLDSAQQQQVSALLEAQPPRPARMSWRQQHMDAILAGFASSAFDARAMIPAPPMSPTDMMREGIAREVAFLTKFVPILRVDQRERLASKMETTKMGHQDSDD